MPFLTLYRETEAGETIAIRIEYDYQPAERPVMWGDFPEPGCPESATLYPPDEIELTDDEADQLTQEAFELEAEARRQRIERRIEEAAYL